MASSHLQAGFAALAAGTACGVAIRPSKLTAADSQIPGHVIETVRMQRLPPEANTWMNGQLQI